MFFSLCLVLAAIDPIIFYLPAFNSLPLFLKHLYQRVKQPTCTCVSDVVPQQHAPSNTWYNKIRTRQDLALLQYHVMATVLNTS